MDGWTKKRSTKRQTNKQTKKKRSTTGIFDLNMDPRTGTRTQVVQESFALSRMSARSTEPEIFTFDRVPAQATAVRSVVPIRPRKRCSRVMYPAQVRMHLPPPERMSPAARWLLVLVLVVLLQIYFEDPCGEPGAAAGPHGLPVRCSGEPPVLGGCEPDRTVPDRDRSPARGYVVALLVYHRLGTDN
uniref:Radiation-inducible immediate-early gene IEX-1 n=1 Tax=Sphaeramia orbicularis TaxID=375764 RepID=A0A673B1F7_9TELE